MQEVNIGGVRHGNGCTNLLLEHQPDQPRPLANPLVKILLILDCKMQNKNRKGFPLFMGSDMGISLGYRAWAGLITQTDASCHRNLLPIPTWKVQNRKFARDSPSEEITHGYIYHLESGLLRRTSIRPIHNRKIRYPAVKIPSIQSWKTQNENSQGIPHQTGSDTGISLEYMAWTWAWSWSPLLGFSPSHAHPLQQGFIVSCPSTSNTQETQVTITDYGQQ